MKEIPISIVVECDIQFARAAKDFYVGEQFSQDSLEPVIQLISDSMFG